MPSGTIIMPSGTIIMPPGTIWHEILSKLTSVAPAAPGAGAPPQRRGLDRAPLASFGKNSGQMVPHGINAFYEKPMVFNDSCH